MFQSVTAVSNCAFVPVIPTMEVWSPVFVPLLDPLKFEAVMLLIPRFTFAVAQVYGISTVFKLVSCVPSTAGSFPVPSSLTI